ncbi:GNAT family N-acetyltransferase [Chengkuizengella axinellae]|uniref:GNAT family N-acetyltransferase n=1 Tax=Chengkuizengella axinellae TaxID=3064388 RepID=A0ABT9J1J1_9BACL|nr:GNAT family N-acetyltransferase [Chengkuizengella sp. 2205SS18-9]MDP5275484.1 GNAT family N-acetyltransferase [Chengkuizengella sp. 2205SS18-9]
MKLRNLKPSDYTAISPLIDEWWGGRKMSHLLPKLFFDHFNDTSFIVEKDGDIIGFLIGFLSQTSSDKAYIHFVGVDPKYRKFNVGRQLYNTFFDQVKQNDRHSVHCITSPVNKTSIAFHLKMGFLIEGGDKEIDGVYVHSDYDSPAEDRVLFMKRI